MPTATVTNRELKNKETEIDLSVPTYKEIHGKLTTTVEYHVVVVSRLQFFKSPKHKESDVVQYMVPRKLQDFENLKAKLEKRYAGTMFPPLPKMALLVNEQVLHDRRNRLNDFLRFLASTPKLCSSSDLLEFLGISSIKAGKFRKGEIKSTGGEGEEDLFEGQQDGTESAAEDTSKAVNFFDDTEEVDTDLFTGGNQEHTDDIFTTPAAVKSDPLDVQLFDEPDLGGGLTVEEEDLFLLPSAKKTETTTTSLFEEEDHSDLLNINDDLDNLLTISTKPKPKPKPPIAAKPKPPIAAKPKPRPAPKPRVSKQKPTTKAETDDLFSLPTDKPTSDLGNDDILKYIQDNADQEDSTLDLF